MRASRANSLGSLYFSYLSCLCRVAVSASVFDLSVIDGPDTLDLCVPFRPCFAASWSIVDPVTQVRTACTSVLAVLYVPAQVGDQEEQQEQSFRTPTTEAIQ